MGCVFCNISQRALYGHLLVYSEPPKSEAELKLHTLFSDIWNMLYDYPALMELPYFEDESYPWDVINNRYPELDEKYKAVFKGIYEFWHFLKIFSLNGVVSGNSIFGDKNALKAGATSYKSIFASILEKTGFSVNKSKDGIALIHKDADIPAAMQQLSKAAMERASVYEKHYEINAHSLFDFMRCSFNGDWEYIITRIDAEMGLGGVLTALKEKCLENGYTLSIHPEGTKTSTSGFGIDIMRGVGGFHITYNPRKTQKFGFGTKNGIGEKKMLEHFDELDIDMQRHFIDICRPCTCCMGCTKGGKNKIFTVNVNYNGNDYALCPMFPRHEWAADEFTAEVIDRLFRYHELQENYNR